MGNLRSVAARRRSPRRRRKQLKGRMVKGVFCFVLVLAFAALATSLPQYKLRRNNQNEILPQLVGRNPSGSRLVNSPLLQPVTATQSSTRAGFSASKCIDGDTTGPDSGFDDRGDDMCHTNEEPAPWIALDFGETVLVNRVEIFNRVACCGDRTENVDVHVADELPTSGSELFSVKHVTPVSEDTDDHDDSEEDDSEENDCEEDEEEGTLFGHFAGPATNGQHIIISGQREMFGRYVIVQMKNGENSPLNLKEVQAFTKIWQIVS